MAMFYIAAAMCTHQHYPMSPFDQCNRGISSHCALAPICPQILGRLPPNAIGLLNESFIVQKSGPSCEMTSSKTGKKIDTSQWSYLKLMQSPTNSRLRRFFRMLGDFVVVPTDDGISVNNKDNADPWTLATITYERPVRANQQSSLENAKFVWYTGAANYAIVWLASQGLTSDSLAWRSRVKAYYRSRNYRDIGRHYHETTLTINIVLSQRGKQLFDSIGKVNFKFECKE
ncbi:hypothetical protein AYI69_g5109 [Smittium culicis]|uniref:Uncharacterized protein n=1 Tax=Smittium culicis TaxID=133412 RepID=A0A1R1X6Y1_9FUNG|nr:hypothetical protein AYI69_g10261 [Smittium culicis]OMJ23129.1 hypothetical protein AYI69_g5109 [Smittium culicis]